MNGTKSTESEHAKLRRENKEAESARKNAAVLAVRLREENERLNGIVGQYEQAVIDTAPKRCPYPGRYVRPCTPPLGMGDDLCRGCSHARLCRIKTESE